MSETEINLNHSLFKEMPVLAETIQMASLSFMMRDSMFLHKLNRFVRALPEEIENQSGLLWDEKFQRRIGDFLIITFDRIDALDKTEILSRIFAAFVSQKINFSQFRKITSGITTAFIEDLERLTDSSCETDSPSDASESLIRAGFIEKDSKKHDDLNTYKISGLGELFVKMSCSRVD